jgi:thiol:disulfide interchange protein
MPKKKRRKPSLLPQFLTIGGVFLLALVLLALKDRSPAQAPASTGTLPQAQLEGALRAGKPALAFFHSNNCEQCIIMVETVEQVFPEFTNTVALVDINVYDPNNEPLLQKVGLQYIPTLIFYDQHGQGQTFVGVMEADVLRQRLNSLAGEQ